MTPDRTLGRRLRRALADRGMSMAALSEQAGLPYTSIQNYAADKQLPGADALLKIKRALSISIDWLLTGEGDVFLDNEYDQPRLITMKDYQRLKKIFVDFDEVFSIKDIWKIYDNDGTLDEMELQFSRESVQRMKEIKPVEIQLALNGRSIDELSVEECLEVLKSATGTGP